MKKYLITSEELYTDIPAIFKKRLQVQLQIHHPQYALYRDKTNENYDEQASKFVKICKNFKGIKSFIHQKVYLAKDVGAQGVHLTSQQFNEIEQAKSIGLEVIISTHTFEEVLQAQELGADAVTYSPIFYSPNKAKPKGIEDLKNVIEKSSIKIFALGGIIDKDELKQLQDMDLYGFASIRYFVNK